MQHSKHGDFNPLDILATAAALKQVDKPEKCLKQKIVIVKPKDGVKILTEKETPSVSTIKDNKSVPTGKDHKSIDKKAIGLIKSTTFVEDGVKKIKLTISPELEKMLNEHNYGNLQKINVGNKSILKLPDVLSLSKDKKVVVKVIDKSTGHVVHDKLLTGVNSGDKNSPQAKETNCDNVITPEQTKHEQRWEGEECIDRIKERFQIKDCTNVEENSDTLSEKEDIINENNEKELILDEKIGYLKSIDSEENLVGQGTSYSVPVCKPVPIEDFDDCNERIDTDIRSPAYEDIDFNDGKTTPNEQTLSSNPYQSLKIDADDNDLLLTGSRENSISAQTDKQNKILEKDGENQYSDNEQLPGEIDSGANNTDRCDMGKSQVLDKIETSDVQERSKTEENISEGISCSVGNPSVSFLMHDHEYAGRYCDDSSEGKNDNSEIPINSDLSQDSGFSDSGLSPDGLELRTFKRDSPSLIPVQSEMLPTFDLCDVNKARDAIVALVNSKGISGVPNDNILPSSSTKTSPKIGKFSIGTFASVCNSTLGLESPEKSQIAFGQRIATSLLSKNSFPTDFKISATVPVKNLIEHIEHDHDYSLPLQRRPANIPFSVQKVNKEIPSKGKTREKKSDSADNRRSKRSNSSEESKEDKLFDVITSENERKGNKNEKLADFLKNGTSDSKLKIQGSYKDDFVYFLNTNFRSRRRASQDVPPTIPPDKIIVPIPKPGDIVVPHLTNEDLQAIKLGKHHLIPAGSIPSSSQSSAASSISTFGQSSSGLVSTSVLTPPPVPTFSTPKLPTNGSMSDVESNIISTILSMESEPCAEPNDTGLFNNTNDSFGINFSEQLTPEQMELLYSAVDQVQSIDTKSTNSSEQSEKVMDNELIKEGNVTDNTATPETIVRNTDSLLNHAAVEKVPDIVPNKDLPAIQTVGEDPTKTKESNPSEQLDFFGSDMKLFPETADVSVTKSDEPDDNAPWIVTVSMYWNDLPAIMLDNSPFLRLVDIHKQMLPAKDTGILKKRCQLLGIEVKNCTEMQRYFLVQYGRAFNSKSNLIISKEDAEALIGYYVNPVSKLPRSDDRRPKIKVAKVSRPRPRPHTNVESGKQKNVSVQEPTPIPVEPPIQKPLGRTRHKKINFLELLKGDSNNNSSETVGTEQKENNNGKGDNSTTIVVVEPPAGWKKSETTSSVKRGENNKKSLKRFNISSENLKRKAEENNILDSSGELDDENMGKNQNLTWLSKKRQRLSMKVNRKPKKPGTLKVKWTIFNKSNRKKWAAKKNKRNILAVVHKDTLSNNSKLNNIQPGNVFMDLYNNENSPCVKCCTCNDTYTVDAFLAHLHDNSGDGKLMSIVTPQVLSLRDTSESQKKMWQSFQLKRKQFSGRDRPQQKCLPQLHTKDKNLDKLVRTVNPLLDKTVRISSRKRKQKQLYPIENYSYSSTARCDVDDTSSQPSKIMKTTSDISLDNVVTRSNEPLLTSFTALEHDV